MKLKLRATRRAGVPTAAAVVGAAVLSAVGGGGPVGATTMPGGTWGQPQAIAGPAALSADQHVSTISCASLGNCTAVGSYQQSGTARPFAVSETDGVWGKSQSLVGAPGAPGSIGPLGDVSCGAPGHCVAAGSYNNKSLAYLATEVKGAWSVRTLPGTIGSDTVTQSAISQVDCTGAGNCAAVGFYNASSTTYAFTLDESGGTWGTPQPVAGLPPGGSSPGQAPSQLDSLSCSGPGDCTAGGDYNVGPGAGYAPFLVSESGGTWGSAQAVPGFAALTSSGGAVFSVSCPDASDCAVAGTYSTSPSGPPAAVFTADEVDGTWEPAKTLDVSLEANPTYSGITVGCRTAGNCVVTGTVAPAETTPTSVVELFAATETSGGWGQGQAIPGAGESSQSGGLSCVPDGNCTVAGTYVTSKGGSQVFASVIGPDGTIGAAQAVSTSPEVEALDCPQDGYCTMAELAGNPAESPTAQLVTEANPASVTLTASASQVSYGSEPAETFTATVSAADGTPTGTVAVTGPSGAACTITLADGTGKCSFSPAQFPVGTYTATGTYSGDPHYLTASGAASVMVAKGKTATRLTPSSVVITVGQGAVETLTVTVRHAGSVAPSGYVTVKDGSSIVCTIALAKGSGSCAVNADQLITRGRVLTAVYPGDGNFLASTAPPAYLTFAPAGPRLAWPAAGRPASPASRLHGRPAAPAG